MVTTFVLIMYRMIVPRPYTATTTTRAMAEDLKEARNRTGPMMHNKAMHIVRVKKMDTAVLMARICPNLANS